MYGSPREGGAADAGDVERDDLDAGWQLADERLEEIEAGADPVAEHQRWSGSRPGAHRDPDLMAKYPHMPQLARHTNAPTPVMSRPTMRVWIVSVPS